MATKEKEIITTPDEPGLNPDWLLDAYRTMVTARRVDDREMALKRQNKIFFQISGAGHEAVQVAMAAHLNGGHDWFYLYYRDRALALAIGQTPLDHLLGAVGAHDDPNSAGRQMPSHFGDVRFNIASASSPTGTQFLQAVGAAEAGQRVGRVAELEDKVTGFREDEVVLVCAGDGATSGGEFWEALNVSCNLKLPIVFLIEDNGYAISVPVEVNTAAEYFQARGGLSGSSHSRVRRHRRGGQLYGFREAVAHCRSQKGPALVHAHTTRPYSHSMSDDERMYRPEAERAGGGQARSTPEDTGAPHRPGDLDARDPRRSRGGDPGVGRGRRRRGRKSPAAGPRDGVAAPLLRGRRPRGDPTSTARIRPTSRTIEI